MNLKNIYLIILCLLVTASCDFGDTNVDPSNPDEVTIPLLLPTAQARIAYFLGGDASRYNGIFTQHYTGGGRQHVVIGRYNFVEADVNTAWNQQYAGSLKDLQVIIDLAAENTDATAGQFTGASKVLTAYLIAMLSDFYEDIPYSEAIQGTENVEPSYDTRDQIYATAHSLLSQAKAELAESSDLALSSTDDLIYGGDASLWIKAANAIDARLYLHEGEYSSALSALANGFTSNADDMEFSFNDPPTENNPWYQFEEQRGDVVMGKYFIDLMVNTNDPRLAYFAVPTNLAAVLADDADPTYAGAVAGNAAGGESTVADLPGDWELAMTCKTCAVPFITYAEQKFIEAEALLRGGNASGAADAANAAIEASLTKVVGSVDPIYIADNSFDAGITLEGLMTQKYVALYAQAESWNDYRRTGYPLLTPVVENNALGAGLQPLRWPLPQSESLFNAENHAANNETIQTPTVLAGATWDATP